jgi:hypothetical protein
VFGLPWQVLRQSQGRFGLAGRIRVDDLSDTDAAIEQAIQFAIATNAVAAGKKAIIVTGTDGPAADWSASIKVRIWGVAGGGGGRLPSPNLHIIVRVLCTVCQGHVPQRVRRCASQTQERRSVVLCKTELSRIARGFEAERLWVAHDQ